MTLAGLALVWLACAMECWVAIETRDGRVNDSVLNFLMVGWWVYAGRELMKRVWERE